MTSSKLLSSLYPELIGRIHSSEGNDIGKLTYGTGKEVVWKCDKNHTYKAPVSSVVRSYRNGKYGCPYCSGKKVLKEESLGGLYPELLSEWDEDKNTLSPYEVTVHSDKKVHWKCNRGHKWKTRISHRTNGSQCPECQKYSQTSFPEQAIYYYIRKLFKSAESNKKINSLGMELDIYIPNFKIAIEYDGKKYHKDLGLDLKKNKKCEEKEVYLIRVRERGCPDIKVNYGKVINYEYTYNHSNLDKVIKDLIYIIEEHTGLGELLNKINVDIERDRFDIYSLLNKNKVKNSLLECYPQVAKEWHPTKNGELTPEQVSYGSTMLVYWICPEGHTYEDTVNHRTSSNRGCPYCSGVRVDKTNSLASIYPKVASYWHPIKNGDLTPDKVSKKSTKRVWWQCKDCDYEWKCSVANRVKAKRLCSKCKPIPAEKGKSLEDLLPNVALLWDKKKNKFNSNEVHPHSKINAYWKCKCGEEWERPVVNQVRSKGCPQCVKVNKKVS